MLNVCDNQISRDCCIALSNMFSSEMDSGLESDFTQIEDMMNFKIGERCSELVAHSKEDVAIPALGN